MAGNFSSLITQRKMAQLEDCIEDVVPDALHHAAFTEITQVIRHRSRRTLDPTTQWLRFLSQRVGDFLKRNDGIFASRSDKGAHTVLLVEEYDGTVNLFLQNLFLFTMYRK